MNSQYYHIIILFMFLDELDNIKKISYMSNIFLTNC